MMWNENNTFRISFGNFYFLVAYIIDDQRMNNWFWIVSKTEFSHLEKDYFFVIGQVEIKCNITTWNKSERTSLSNGNSLENSFQSGNEDKWCILERLVKLYTFYIDGKWKTKYQYIRHQNILQLTV